MGRSWAHEVRPLSEEQGAWRDGEPERPSWLPEERWPWSLESRRKERRQCRSHRRCEGLPEFAVRYSYVTGGRGRVSWAEKLVCREHAEKFAKRYGCPMPEAA